MSNSLKDQVAIVGIGHTEYGRQLGRSPYDVIAEAMQKALDDAGLEWADLDGIGSNSGSPGSADTDALPNVLGLNVKGYWQTWSHGRYCGTALTWAAMNINAGIVNYVALVHGSGGGRGGRRQVGGGGTEEAREGGGGHAEAPEYGMTSPGAGAALATRRYFDKYNATSRQLASVATTLRKHANLNPNALMKDRTLTVDDHQTSRFICEPLHLYDYCLVTEGGTCVILASAERAKDLKKPPVYIMGTQPIPAGRGEFIFGNPGLGIGQQDNYEYTPKADDHLVYRMSGAKHADIDALFTYDAFTPLVWFTLERFGFLGPGEAPSFCDDGNIALGGQLPVNTNGGLHSEVHKSGWNHQIEIARQLRGEAGARQVKDAEIIQWANSYGDSLIYRR